MNARDALAALIERAERRIEDRRLSRARRARYVKLWRWLIARLAKAILLEAEDGDV